MILFLFLFAGILTALIACFIDIVIDQISIQKYGYLKEGMHNAVGRWQGQI